MQTKTVKLSDIKPADYNPRVKLKKTDAVYKDLKLSIDEFGLVVPLIINEKTGNLVSGHQRLNILIDKGVEETEAIIIDMEPEKEKALCIALNKITGQWDYGKLADLMEELLQADINTDVTGFSEKEIAELIGELDDLEDTPDVESVGKKEDTKEGVLCIVGEYTFRMPDNIYKDLMADIREKVGFSKEMVEGEMKRRLLK